MKRIIVLVAAIVAVSFIMMQACGLPKSSEEETETREVCIEPVVEQTPLFQVRKDGLYGFIDKKGNVVVEPQFYGVHWEGFSEGLAFVRTVDEFGVKWGAIDSNGEMVIEPQFGHVRGFSEGLAAAQMYCDSLRGYIGRNGEWVIEPMFDIACPFSEGLAVVEVNHKRGYIDRTGSFVIEPQFDEASDFSEGLAAVKINDKFGFIDTKGKMVIVPQYDGVLFGFSGGLVDVMIDDKVGLIDKNGNWVINPILDNAGPFHDGLWQVCLDGIYSWVDSDGEVFDNVYDYYCGLCAWPDESNKYGYINKYLEFEIAPQYDVAYGFNNGLALVGVGEDLDYMSEPWEKGMWGYIDMKGNMVYYGICE